MNVSKEPVTLTAEEVEILTAKLSKMRHNINNNLSLVVAAAELIRYKPEMRERMAITLAEQPNKIIAEITQFSKEFQKAFHLTQE